MCCVVYTLSCVPYSTEITPTLIACYTAAIGGMGLISKMVEITPTLFLRHASTYNEDIVAWVKWLGIKNSFTRQVSAAPENVVLCHSSLSELYLYCK